MDDTALQTGLLLDLAKQQHETADGALKRLAEHTRSLDPLLRDTLRRALSTELQNLQAELDEAAAALRAIHRTARSRAVFLTPLFAVLGAVLGLLPLLVFVPSRAEIAERQATVTALDGRGGRAHLNHCARLNDTPQLCARIDKASGAFGPEGDYYILK